MFIHYMYVDITMFERVTVRVSVHFLSDQHRQAIMEYISITSTRYHMCYYFFSLSLACFGGYLQRFAMRYRKIY